MLECFLSLFFDRKLHQQERQLEESPELYTVTSLLKMIMIMIMTMIMIMIVIVIVIVILIVIVIVIVIVIIIINNNRKHII